MNERDEDTLFVLRMMDFIFKVKSVIFPDKLHEMLESYPAEERGYFTPNLTEATLILMEIEDEKRKSADINYLLFYSSEAYDIYTNFNCLDFFKFCVRYGTKSVSDYLGGNMDAPSIVFETLCRIIRFCRQKGAFNAEAWVELDECARHIIARSRGGNAAEPVMETISETEQEKLRDRLCAESEFVLRVMNYVFMLHFKELPSEFKKRLEEFSENPHPHFSPTVQAAIIGEMNIQASSVRNISENSLEIYYETQLMQDFNVKTFLEACVCFSKKAMREYFEEYRAYSPQQIHGYLTLEIGDARRENKFTDWVDMEQAGIDIIAEYDGKEKHDRDREQEYLDSLGVDALLHFADTESESGPGYLRGDSPDRIECPSCVCI